MNIDAGRKEVDDLLGKMERKVAKEYRQAAKEVEKKLGDYLDKFHERDMKKLQQRNDGKITQIEYQNWRVGQIAIGNRWRTLRDDLAQDYANANRIAESIVDGYMPEVYALSHNYATYEVETGANIDTSYTLYDRQTVERLMRDNPQMLPKPGKQMSQAIREGKVKRWNQKQVQSVMMQSLLQGEAIPKIAKRLASKVAVRDTKSAVRYARTMTTGAENAGRQDGYKRAVDMGVKMKHGWVAVLDAETRDTHRQLDGQQQEVGKPFYVDGMKIRYPGDPTAPGKLVWNCRCCLVAVVAGSNQDVTDLSNRNTDKMGGMSYDEWKNAKRNGKQNETAANAGDQNKPTQAAAPKTFSEKIAEIKNRIAAKGGNIEESDLHEAGSLLAEEVKAYREPLKKEMERAEKEFADYKKKIKYDETHREMREAYRSLSSKKDPEEWKKTMDRYVELDKTLLEMRRNPEYRRLNSAATNARLDYEGTREGNADWLKAKLAETRPMGSAGLDVKGHLQNSRSPMRKVVEKAYDHYPTAWVEDSVKYGTLSVGKVDRGYYWHSMREIKISGTGGGDSLQTAIHEVGHRFEHVHSGIVEAEKVFYDRRTAGEKSVWLGAGYAKKEVTKKDNFIHPYMGKDYGGTFAGYELVSMGFDHAYCDPTKLAKDPDMESWIYGLLLLR